MWYFNMSENVNNVGKGNSQGFIKSLGPDSKVIEENMKKHSVWLNKQLKDKPVPKEDYTTLMKRAENSQENYKLEHMTENERKEYIMSKFMTAKNNNDKVGMFDALAEFYDYDCRLLDKKFGITTAKNFLKDKSGLNNLVDYLDKVIDNEKDGLSALERTWEIIKGCGDALDSLIGTQGLTMVGGLGAATKAVTLIPKAGTLLGGAIQAFFAIDGTVMLTEGSMEAFNADTKDEARAGGAKAGMGAIMTGGAAHSIKNVRKAKSQNTAEKSLSHSEDYAVRRVKLKEQLKNVKKVVVKETNNGDVLIEIPKGKMQAPSEKFAETDAAFKDIVCLSKAEFLELNKKSGDEFILAAFTLLKDKMGVKDAPIKLKVENEQLSMADPETATVHIGRNWQGGDKPELLGAVAHELNHMLQYKEMHINSIMEGVDYNISPEFKSWIEKQPGFFEGHNQYYYDKANIYTENFKHYIEPEQNLSAYKKQPVEAESHRRGDIVRDEFKDVTSNYKLDPLEEHAINMILERYPSIDSSTKMELKNVAVEHLKEPRFANTNIYDFVDWFIKEYPQ